jgi:4-hydroxy-3-polyprenylbenzoate decarboxylase
MIAVAMSGASGQIMGIRLVEELLKAGEKVTAIVSQPARQVIEYEILRQKNGYASLTDLLLKRGMAGNYDNLQEFDNTDFFSPIASGSAKFDAVVVVPCSMKTLSAIVHGYADSLITRICDVALKEKRTCILVPRETPLSVIHLENMHKAALAGADILPPMPGFYTLPESVDDIINFFVGKIFNLLKKEHQLFKSWGQK